jgi:hypothetical protein
METKEKSHINKGVSLAIAWIIVDVILQLSHKKLENWVVFLQGGIIVIGVIISLFIHKSNTNKTFNFSNSFGYGFQVCAVAVCLMFLYSLLSIYFIFPSYPNDMYLQSIVNAKQLQNLPLSSIDSQKEVALKVIRIGIISAMVMTSLGAGLVGALIGSIIPQKTTI